MRVFYPQALLRVTAIVQTSRTVDETKSVTFLAYPRKVTLTRNPFDEADSCQIELDPGRFPVLPRSIRQFHVQLYAGDAGGLDNPGAIERDDFVRFIGYGDEPELTLGTDSEFTITCRDYTAILLDAKRPPAKSVPRWEDRLDVALRRVLDEIPGGENIRLRIDQQTGWPALIAGAPVGITSGAVPAKPDDTAWVLIKRACDPLGLIPRIVLDELVVAPSRGLATSATRAVFTAGENLLKYKEKRSLTRLREGIGLRAYDLSRLNVFIAYWPPIGDASIQKHAKVPVKRKATPPGVPPKGEKRIFFPWPPIESQEALEAVAQRVYEGRSRQEFRGSFSCGRMLVDGSNDGADESESFDVTRIESGDQVFIQIPTATRQMLGGLSNTGLRHQYLVDQGYDFDLATTLVDLFESGVESGLAVYCHLVTQTWDAESSEYTLDIDFMNLISATGG